jgi:hypothetical protein
MTRDEQKKLFAEWEADYAARREELAKPIPRLPSPSEIARDTGPGKAETGNGQDRGGRGM